MYVHVENHILHDSHLTKESDNFFVRICNIIELSVNKMMILMVERALNCVSILFKFVTNIVTLLIRLKSLIVHFYNTMLHLTL